MFYITGPTASGKSALALELAMQVGGEVVNADAFQLYRELPITTAQPSAADCAEVAHHLYGVLPVTEPCDAQKYRRLVEPVVKEIAGRGRWPIVVGGSGLYVKALTHGLAELPTVDPRVRAKIAALTPAERSARLLELDPQAMSNVPFENDRYVSRALEVCLLTGQPQSQLRQSWKAGKPQFQGVYLRRDRLDLVERIENRTREMFANGLVEEVRALPNESITAGKAIGVRQVRSYLAGELTLDGAMEAIATATRQYSRRQSTWFRREQGFQTICPRPDSTVTFSVEQILQAFPCLSQPPPSDLSLST